MNKAFTLCLAVLAFSVPACSTDENPPDDGSFTDPIDIDTDDWLACGETDDCTLVSPSCCGCATLPLAKDHWDDYWDAMEEKIDCPPLCPDMDCSLFDSLEVNCLAGTCTTNQPPAETGG